MSGETEERDPIGVARVLDALLARDGAGGSWLPGLLQAAPRGGARLGELAGSPGWIEAPVAVRTETGRRGAFEYLTAPSRRMLAWFVDHPDQLVWPGQEMTREALTLRRALIDDAPPGARKRAQDRAHELLSRSGSLGPAWWRFEAPHTAPCVLVTDRVLLLVRDAADDAAATPWFPRRVGLVRDLEAAQRLADGSKVWGVLGLGARGRPLTVEALRQVLEAGAPHLDSGERTELADGYLGELGIADAMGVTGLDPSLPGESRV